MNRLSRVDQVSLVSFSGFSGGDFGIQREASLDSWRGWGTERDRLDLDMLSI